MTKATPTLFVTMRQHYTLPLIVFHEDETY